jgi:hypothetical protein
MFASASMQGALLGSVAQAPNGDGAAIKLPPTASLSLAQLSALGHAASRGLTRLNPDAGAALAESRDIRSDCKAMIAAIPLSMVRLCISRLTLLRAVA